MRKTKEMEMDWTIKGKKYKIKYLEGLKRLYEVKDDSKESRCEPERDCESVQG